MIHQCKRALFDEVYSLFERGTQKNSKIYKEQVKWRTSRLGSWHQTSLFLKKAEGLTQSAERSAFGEA